MSPGQRSFAELVTNITRHGRALAKAEFDLFVAELTANGSRMMSAGMMAVVACAIAFAALNFALLGVMFLLMHYGFAAFAAAFIVGGGCLFVSILVALIARSRLNATSLVPRRTIAQIQLDAAMLERSLHNG